MKPTNQSKIIQASKQQQVNITKLSVGPADSELQADGKEW